jgi:hypothetical protein
MPALQSKAFGGMVDGVEDVVESAPAAIADGCSRRRL